MTLTNEELINVLNSLIRQFKRCEQPTAETGVKLALGAVLKQTPRKVLMRNVVDISVYYCPYCRILLMRIGRSFIQRKVIIPGRPNNCYNCGQRLDWGDKDDE